VIERKNRCSCNGVAICCIAILLFLFYIPSSFTQIPELNFRYYSKSEGLASSNTLDIIQDSLGYIWVGTNNGLDKFDGYTFTHYKYNSSDSLSVPNNRIQKLFIDSKGILWIGTSRGVCYYNQQKDRFNRIPTFILDTEHEDYNFVDISENQDGELFFLTSTRLFKYDPVNNNLRNIFYIGSNNANMIYIDGNDFIWIGTYESGIIKLGSNYKPAKTYQKGNNFNSLNCNSVFDIVKWDNSIWIATLGGGINILDLETDNISTIPTIEENENYSFELYVDNFNQMWVIDFKGLRLYDKSSRKFIGYYPDEKNPYSIKSNASVIFQDKQNNYWVIHEPGGIAVSTVPRGFKYFTTGENKKWHTSDSKILSICEDKNNNTWLGFASSGINIFHWKTGHIEKLSHNPDNPYSVGQGAVLNIFNDSENDIWVSTYFTGLQRYDAEKKRFHTFKPDPENPYSISTTDIRAIREMKNGDLLIAAHGKGVDRFNKKNGKFYHYTVLSHKLSNEWVFDVLEDSKGNIWAATAWGLNVLKNGATNFRFYHHVQNDSTSLSDNQVLCLFEDSKGKILIGTTNGLNIYNEKYDNFSYINLALDNQYICGILEDKYNNYWISTQEGISRISSNTLSIENFDNNEGVRSGEFYPRSVYNSYERGLMFGGTKGFDIIEVDNLIRNLAPPNVIITKFKLFNEEINCITHPELLENNISATKSITLQSYQNTINIGYVGFNHINPKNNKYAYKLEGFDLKWNEVGPTREAVYTNLDHGEYTFKVIASNNDNVWSRSSASIKIIILPPWYKTTVFRIFILISIIILIIFVNYFRTRQFMRQQHILEQKVDEKTEELLEKNKLLEEKTDNLKEAYALLIERQHQLQVQSRKMKKQSDNLENANKELQSLNSTKDKLFSIIAHDLSNPFNTILGFSDLLTQNFDKMKDKDKIRLIGIINSSSVKFYSLLQNLLLWARTQTKRLSHLPENVNLRNAINDILDLLKAGFTQKNITVSFDSLDDIIVYADVEMTKTILRNLLNNAIKFTPVNGNIDISLSNKHNGEKKGNEIFISIKDSGVGISPDTMPDILESGPITPGEGTEGERGTGLGLTICKEFLKINGGRLLIESEEGKGSTFTFSLPVAKNTSASS
jgi:signal transduction histidine kinase/ligand-binding sensor domain-containing protein